MTRKPSHLDERRPRSASPRLFLLALLLRGLPALLEVVHRGGDHLGRAVCAARERLGILRIRPADERVGVGLEPQRVVLVLAVVLAARELGGGARLEQLVDLVPELARLR